MQKKREYSLDVLKFIGIIIIIFHHYQQVTGAYFEGTINFWNWKFNWAYLVELFYILSGYFTYAYVEKINADSIFIIFFKKKYFRFFPMLLVSGLVCLVLDYIYYVIILEHSLPHSVWGIVTALTGISYWLKCTNCFVMLNGAMWYISVLLLCYAIFFFVTYIAKRWKISPYILYVVAMCIGMDMNVICTTYKVCIPFFTTDIGKGLCCFFLGLLLRHFLEKYPIHCKHITMIISGVIIGFLGILYIKKNEYFSDLWYVLCFLIYPAVVIFFKNEFISKIFSGEKFRHLGGITFNAFVWHIPVLRFVLIVASLKSLNLDSVKAMLMVTCLIFLVGEFSHFFIEKPIEKKLSIWLKDK